MHTVFAVYRTDAWHSYASRDLIGIATSHELAIELVRLQMKREDEQLDKEQLFNLGGIKQTQGYSGEGEFQIEDLYLDTLF